VIAVCSQAVLDEIGRRIVIEARNVLGGKLDKVILYGSYARGDYDGESDIDIMVLADIPASGSWKLEERMSKLVCGLDLEYDVLVSLYVKDCATFYEWLGVLPFYQNVVRDGVLLGA
jgi:predicted nucleotidyltransferase